MRTLLALAALLLIATVAYAVFHPNHLAGFSGTYSNAQSAPVDTPQTTVQHVSFSVLAQGARSTITNRKNYLITSSDQLTQLWAMVDAKGKAPAIDFGRNSIVAVFAGTQPTAGYSIVVSDIRDSSSGRSIIVTIATPNSACTLSQKQTEPYQIIEVPTTTLAFSHQDLSTTTSCL